MNSPLRHEPERSRAAELLRRLAGLALPEHRWSSLRASLARLDGDGSVDAVLDRIEAGDARAQGALLAAVTVPETYLFRHPVHFEVLAEHARVAARSGAARRYRVLSAGCATGEEAWSAAAVLDKIARPTGLAWEVEGWELDSGRIAQARAGRYSAWSARSGLAGYDDAFVACERGWAVHPRLRAAVRFVPVTLEPGSMPSSLLFDVVFLRNVAIYWAPECASAMIDAVARLVRPSGLLLLGASEPESLARAEWQVEWRGFVRVATRRSSPLAATHEHARERGPTRLHRPTLTRPRPQPVELGPRERERERTDPLAPIRALADRGCYVEALALLDDLPPRPDAELHLWRGIVCASLGQRDDALTALRKAVFLAPDDPSCRAWLAVALEACGRHQAATRERRNLDELRNGQELRNREELRA